VLGGSGIVGNTTVLDGGRLAPGNSVGTLIVDGDLSLSSEAVVDFELGGAGTAAAPGSSDRILVSGDLALNGTLNLIASDDAGDAAPGLGYYRLMTYGGELSSNSAVIGTTPEVDADGYQLQVGGGRVDLLIAAVGEDTLQHWQGGDGLWNASASQWLNQGGNVPSRWAGKHAIFKDADGHSGGEVTVEGDQGFQGLQFVDDDYRLEGTGRLVTDGAGSEIRVLAEGAFIATNITGAAGIIKTEAGELTLA